MSEADLLGHIARLAATKPLGPRIEVGPGDDCAVVTIRGRLLVTVDQLVDGRHYDHGTAPIDLVARKALARSISDIAAMAGTPVCAVVAGCCPPGFPYGYELVDAIHRWGRALSCPVIGGDLATHDGRLVLSVTVLGECHATRGPVLRSGARAGDGVWVTGALGGSYRTGRHLSFPPRVTEGIALADLLGDRLSSMIDVSDGLGRDTARIARASGVRIALDAAAFPMALGVESWEEAAGDGEDYELVCTVTERAGDAAALGALGLTRIGEVYAGEGCIIRAPEGWEVDAASMGWDHR
jgi:thiamine-monophosphate kinase